MVEGTRSILDFSLSSLLTHTAFTHMYPFVCEHACVSHAIHMKKEMKKRRQGWMSDSFLREEDGFSDT